MVILLHKWLVWDDITLQPSPLVSRGTSNRENWGEAGRCGNSKLGTWAFIGSHWSVKAFCSSFIHFYSPLANFSRGTSLRLYKAEWLLMLLMLLSYMLGDILSGAVINSKVFGSTFLKKPFAFSPILPEFSLCFWTFFPTNMCPIIESKATMCLFS